MSAWNLRRNRIACAGCSSGFEERARYFSLLSADGGELARSDFCQVCWSSRPAASDDLLWWRTRHLPAKRRGLTLNLEALEALFLALEGRAALPVQEMRFLLCLVLMRKRRLKIVRMARVGSADVFLVRRPRRQEELTVFVHDFTPERVGELREELRALFNGDASALEAAGGLPTEA